MLILTFDDAKIRRISERYQILSRNFSNLYVVEITENIILAAFLR